jgi:hypothetical protein
MYGIVGRSCGWVSRWPIVIVVVIAAEKERRGKDQRHADLKSKDDRSKKWIT